MLAVLHLTGLAPETEGTVLLNGESVNIPELDMAEVSGTIVNAKGEKTKIDTKGISLSELFSRDVTVTASDSYSAVIRADELDKAYLVTDGDGLRLVVFGDNDSKRNVKNVAEVWEK